MKESEMRERIEKLIERALRVAAVPASVGLTAALGGCGPADFTPVDGGEAGMSVAVYSAPVPDPGPVARYMGPMPVDPVPVDAGPVAKYMGPMPVDPDPDPGPVAKYMGPMPVDPVPVDAGPVAKYMGPMPG